MAPSLSAAGAAAIIRQEAARQNQVAISAATKAAAAAVEDEPSSESSDKMAETLKKELLSMKNIVSCASCMELAYEPFTLACGHTYCYTCLCSWFGTNRHKMTCPGCRRPVQTIPVPSFMIRDLVDVFLRRTELMTGDETVEMHRSRKEEEAMKVADDKDSPGGLFSGYFKDYHQGGRKSRVMYDDVDHLERCVNCLFEVDPEEPYCSNCGEDLGRDMDADFSDDLDEMEFDLDEMDGWHGGIGSDFDEAEELHNYMRREIVNLDSGESDSGDEEHSDDDVASSSLQDFIVDESEGGDSSRLEPHTSDIDEAEDVEDSMMASLARTRRRERVAQNGRRQSRPQIISSDSEEAFDTAEEELTSQTRHSRQRNTSMPQIVVDSDEEDSDASVVPAAGARKRHLSNGRANPTVVLDDSDEEDGESVVTRDTDHGAGFSPLHGETDDEDIDHHFDDEERPIMGDTSDDENGSESTIHGRRSGGDFLTDEESVGEHGDGFFPVTDESDDGFGPVYVPDPPRPAFRNPSMSSGQQWRAMQDQERQQRAAARQREERRRRQLEQDEADVREINAISRRAQAGAGSMRGSGRPSTNRAEPGRTIRGSSISTGASLSGSDEHVDDESEIATDFDGDVDMSVDDNAGYESLGERQELYDMDDSEEDSDIGIQPANRRRRPRRAEVRQPASDETGWASTPINHQRQYAVVLPNASRPFARNHASATIEAASRESGRRYVHHPPRFDSPRRDAEVVGHGPQRVRGRARHYRYLE